VTVLRLLSFDGTLDAWEGCMANYLLGFFGVFVIVIAGFIRH